MITYEEILNQAKQLSFEDRLRLADALLEEELGFGMWSDRAQMADVAVYVERMRNEDVRTREGGLKSPEEFLREVERFDE
jgi:hypothetical protein